MKAIKLLEKEMREGVQSVLKGKASSYEAKNINPEMIDKYMVELEFERVGEFETNGWDYDWWLHYTNGTEKYVAYGGGYYGNFEFWKDEE